MTAYLTVIVLLYILSLVETGRNGHANAAKAACALLVVFAGLRLETGFDWLEYENYFNLTQPIWESEPQYITPNLLVEPGFAVYVLLLKSLGLNFQALLFSIALINMLVIYLFAKRYCSRTALVFLVYFGLVFLAGQMAAIRQTLSYSFVLLAFMRRDDQRIIASMLLSIIAVSIHTFSIVLVILIYLRVKVFPVWLVAVAAFFGVLTAFSGFNIIPILADTLLPVLGGGFLATKLSLYGDYEGSSISLASLMFIPVHLGAYYLLVTQRFEYEDRSPRLTRFAIIMTLMSLTAHSYFGMFPALWNRLSYLTFLLQTVALIARYRVQFTRPLLGVVSATGAVSMGTVVIVYALTSPTSLPYLPYQNAVVAWATGDYGDGRQRYDYAFRQAELEIANRRR